MKYLTLMWRISNSTCLHCGVSWVPPYEGVERTLLSDELRVFQFTCMHLTDEWRWCTMWCTVLYFPQFLNEEELRILNLVKTWGVYGWEQGGGFLPLPAPGAGQLPVQQAGVLRHLCWLHRLREEFQHCHIHRQPGKYCYMVTRYSKYHRLHGNPINTTDIKTNTRMINEDRICHSWAQLT